jgi:hypothetical protein
MLVGRIVDEELLAPRPGVERSRREHTDDARRPRGRERVQPDRPVDHIGIAAEGAEPVVVGQNHDGLRIAAVIGRHQRPAESRVQPENAEVVRRHEPADGTVRLALACDGEGPVAVLDELIDRRRGILVVADLDEREAHVIDADQRGRMTKVEQPVRVDVRQRLQQYAVDNTEDRRIHADAEPERQHERHDVTRRSRQPAHCHANGTDHDCSLQRNSPAGPTTICTSARVQPLLPVKRRTVLSSTDGCAGCVTNRWTTWLGRVCRLDAGFSGLDRETGPRHTAVPPPCRLPEGSARRPRFRLAEPVRNRVARRAARGDPDGRRGINAFVRSFE